MSPVKCQPLTRVCRQLGRRQLGRRRLGTRQLGRRQLGRRKLVGRRQLEAAKSSYLAPFETLSQSIQNFSIEADNNLRFLESITPQCEALAEADPSGIPAILPTLLKCIRMIWSLSKFYNTEERLTGLLRKISNEIIHRCRAKISLDDIFDGDVEVSMVSLEESIACGVAWKRIYKRTAAAVAASSSREWNFDDASIFAQIDAPWLIRNYPFIFT